MRFEPKNIEAAAKIAGCTPEDLRHALARRSKRDSQAPVMSKRKWISMATDVILSVPADHNAENMAEMLYDQMVLGKAVLRRR